MSTSALPALTEALFTNATTALGASPDLTVYLGWGVTEEPGDYLMIGVDNVLSPAPDTNGAHSEQDWAHATGTARDEKGEITCAAYSWNGDDDPKAAIDAAFATTAAVENMLRTNPSQGVATVLWTSYGTGTDYSIQRGPDGASVVVVFKVFFKARI